MVYSARGGGYVDSVGRRSYLAVEIVLPESLAKTLAEEIKKNPKVIRKIVDATMTQTLGIDEAVWKTGYTETSWGKSKTFAIRPPYEKWDADNGGKAKLYFEEPETSTKADLEF